MFGKVKDIQLVLPGERWCGRGMEVLGVCHRENREREEGRVAGARHS